jgi:TRAP-type C4-dicarboxylate transport system permease small subunit
VSSLATIISRICGIGMGTGAAFLVAMMLLVLANVIYRLFGHAVFGSYELSEMMVVVTVAFALAYAAAKKSHVVVRIIVSRFPRRAQALTEAVMSLLSLGTWAVIAWAGTIVMSERWLGEKTELLLVPLLPFRVFWLIGLILFCLVYLLDMLTAIRRAVEK